MNFREAIAELGRPLDWREAILSIQDEHGKGTTRWLADAFGVSQRTAQRWLKGDRAPSVRGGRRDAVRAAGVPNRVAARALRNAQTISVGRVKVRTISAGAPDGSRPVSVVDVDEALRPELEAAADAIAAGQWADADKAMSDALLGAYAAREGDNRDAVRTVLAISEYPNGIEVT